MKVQRISVAEGATAFLVAELPTGEAVTVTTFYNMTGASSPALTSSVATEIGSTGIYYWCLSNMDTAPAAAMDIAWIMTYGSTSRTDLGQITIGGYADVPKENTALLNTIDGIVDDILTDTGTTIPGTITTLTGKVDVVDGIVDDILIDTGTTIPGTITTIDGIVDSILVDTGTDIPAAFAVTDGKIDVIDANVDQVETAVVTDIPAILGIPVVLDGAFATIGGMLTKMADDNGGASFDAETDSLNAIAAGESTSPTVVQIREEMDSNSAQLIAIVADTGDIVDKMEAGSLPPNPVQWAT